MSIRLSVLIFPRFRTVRVAAECMDSSLPSGSTAGAKESHGEAHDFSGRLKACCPVSLISSR